jgi:hypothetical protein
MRSSILVLHIAAGTLGILAGFFAISFRKGSRLHNLTGDVFVLSMLVMSACGMYLAVTKSDMGTFLGGAFTFYLVATAWKTARYSVEETGIFDWAALLIALGVAGSNLTYGFEAAYSVAGQKYGYGPGLYFFSGFLALLAAAGDLRMLVHGGISGTRRLARHLWRVCYAWFIAAGSIFLARPKLFPALLQKTGVLYGLSFLPLVVMVFWLIRIRFAQRRARVMVPKWQQKPVLGGVSGA